MRSPANKDRKSAQEPERLEATAASMHQHQLGALTFNSASRQDLVKTINRWMIGQQAHSSVAEPDDQAHTLQYTTTQANPGKKPSGFCIGYINPHVYNLSRQNAQVNEFLTHCDLVCIDGLGISLALRVAGGLFNQPPVHRVVALNLFDALVNELTASCMAVLIGVNDCEVAQSAANINKLQGAFNIVDVMDGFSTDEQYSQFLIAHQDIQWVLIGAGTPRSESIALIARRCCPHAIVFHMGAGTIKVYAGSKRRSPQWVSDCGFEWAHRMIFEPHTRDRYTHGAWEFLTHLMADRRKAKTRKQTGKQP